MVAIHKIKTTLTSGKAAYIGMCMLELSKVLIHELHHDCIKNKYCNKSRLLFTNNDSLMYKIKTENVHGDFSKKKELFDISDYPAYEDSNAFVAVKISTKIFD